VSVGDEPERKGRQGKATAIADPAMDADAGVGGVMGLAVTPSVSDDSGSLAGGAEATQPGGVASGISPWDKYNHCGGEAPDRITAGNDFRLAASAFTQSQPHLEENPHRSRHFAAFCHWPVNHSQGVQIYFTIVSNR